MTHREMIQGALDKWGWQEVTWRTNEYGQEEVLVGLFRLLTDTEMAFAGEEGELIVSVVGAAKHGNERVYYGFMPEGTDCPSEVNPGDLESV
jgi:hypothetical protein